MATLTETAYYTRRTINWAILVLICYIIIRLLWSGIAAVWLEIFPPKPRMDLGFDRHIAFGALFGLSQSFLCICLDGHRNN